MHFALVVLYTLYAYCVLWWHYKQYLIVRQHYLVKGDDPNYWRGSLRVCLRVC